MFYKFCFIVIARANIKSFKKMSKGGWQIQSVTLEQGLALRGRGGGARSICGTAQ